MITDTLGWDDAEVLVEGDEDLVENSLLGFGEAEAIGGGELFLEDALPLFITLCTAMALD